MIQDLTVVSGNSLAVKWLRLHASTTGSMVEELRSHINSLVEELRSHINSLVEELRSHILHGVAKKKF